jgi:hypothetical protein
MARSINTSIRTNSALIVLSVRRMGVVSLSESIPKACSVFRTRSGYPCKIYKGQELQPAHTIVIFSETRTEVLPEATPAAPESMSTIAC